MKIAPPWFACVSSFAIVAACGGSDAVTIGENGPDAGAPGTPATSSGNAGTSPVPTDAGLPPLAEDACVSVAWYRDEDGAGVGGSTTVASCTSLGAGWVTTSGDCDDKNPLVFPGQTAWFGRPYGGSNATKTSFDYDCSKIEEEKPGQAKAGPCQVGADGCTGAGYLPVDPASLANRYCGSLRRRFCRFIQGGGPGSGGQCVQAEGQTEDAFECH